MKSIKKTIAYLILVCVFVACGHSEPTKTAEGEDKSATESTSNITEQPKESEAASTVARNEADTPKGSPTEELAKKWLLGLSSGDNMEEILNMMAIPFNFDEKRVLETKEQVRQFMQGVIDRFGKRYPTIEKIERVEGSFLGDQYTTIVIKLQEENSPVGIVIDESKMKVIGVRD
ncbi:MAG: hypothetical protein MK212_10795 [Saprospiraceae bacterium]|nr:hypothetical protein [Saprospiraceae bacterium]